MNEKALTVVVIFEAFPGKEEELESLLKTAVSPSRLDKGCLNYDLHLSLEDPTKFLFYENWESKQDHQAHMASTHIQDILKKVRPLCKEPQMVSFWKKL